MTPSRADEATRLCSARTRMLGRISGIRSTYGLALVDADTWESVMACDEAIAAGLGGPRVPGTASLRLSEVTKDPDLIPPALHGVPPRHDGSLVRWFEPPNPLSLTAAECRQARGSVTAGERSRSGRGAAGMLPNALLERLFVAVSVADALTWQVRPTYWGFPTVLHYCTGDEFAWHTDTTALDTAADELRDGWQVSLVVQLSGHDDYTGGSLEFITDEGTLTAPRTQGTVCVFASRVRHHVTTVTSGERSVITAFLAHAAPAEA